MSVLIARAPADRSTQCRTWSPEAVTTATHGDTRRATKPRLPSSMAFLTQLWNRRTLAEIGESAVIGTATAAWVAVADQPAVRRRLSRLLIAIAAYAVPLPRSDRSRGVADAAKASPREPGNPSGYDDAAKYSGPLWRRFVVAVVAGITVAAVSRGLTTGVDRRWLRSLSATHRYPRRALAARVGVLAFSTSSALRLLRHHRPIGLDSGQRDVTAAPLNRGFPTQNGTYPSNSQCSRAAPAAPVGAPDPPLTAIKVALAGLHPPVAAGP